MIRINANNHPNGTATHSININRENPFLVSIWDFGPIPSKIERRAYMYNDHPAKMRPSLVRAILQLYGESPVLDPMAGIGTTLVEAKLLGMKAVGVEIEEKFVKQANQNIFRVKNRGYAECHQGDARALKFQKNIFNSIVFSPPYWKTLGVGKVKRDPKHESLPRPYSSNVENIGNREEYQSYVNDMLKVYGECYRVLKSGKYMVIVIKDIRRKGVTVPLAADTLKLCETVGFQVFDIVINKLYFLSYWQILRAIKDQDAKIKHPLKIHEYVLIFRKP